MSQTLIITSQEQFFKRLDLRIYFRKSKSRWYDIISNSYNFLGDFYKQYRIELINSLAIQEGDIVIDLCSGTGRNIKYLLDKVGPKGKVIAVDNSTGMLRYAKKKFNKSDNVYFIHTNCEDLDFEILKQNVGEIEKIDHIICSLGYSVVENPKIVFENSFKILKKEGGYSIMDLFIGKENFFSRIIDFLAFAESKRDSWTIIEKYCQNIVHKRHKLISGEIFMISGEKNHH